MLKKEAKKAAKVLFFDIVYYALIFMIIYFAGIFLANVLSEIENSGFVLGTYSLVDDIRALNENDLSMIKGAGEGISSIGLKIFFIISGIFLAVVLNASLFKSFGYSILLDKKFSLKFFFKSFFVNIFWRGIFFVLAFLGSFIVKPEMLFAYWIILLVLFVYMTPFVYLNLDEKSKVFWILGSGIKNSFRKFLSALAIYGLIGICILGLGIFFSYFRIPFGIFVSVIFFMVGISVGKMFLAGEFRRARRNP